MGFAGIVPHEDVARLCDGFDLGLALTPSRSDDPNLEMLAGASNKVFEFMARSVVPIVNQHPQWRRDLVEPGLALAVEPACHESMAALLGRCLADTASIREAGERGRRRILGEWNYERAFEPVRRLVAGPAGSVSAPQLQAPAPAVLATS